MTPDVQLGSPWIRPTSAGPAGNGAAPAPADVLFISPYLEEASLSPTFQIVRDQLSDASKVVTRRVLEEYLSADEIDDYTDVIRYAKRYPLSLGMLSIATYLREHGIRTAYVQLEAERERDQDNPRWLEDALARALSTYRPRVIGVGGVTSEVPRLRRVCAILRDLAGDVPIVAGGPHVTFRPQDMLDGGLADVVVHGEGEAPMLEIVNRLGDGRGVAGVPGTSTRDGDRVATTPIDERVVVSDLPQPDYGLLSDEMKAKGIIYAMYTRACPYKCNYCSEGRLFGSKLRGYHAAEFVTTLDYIAETLGWKFIHIADSTFGLPPRGLHALLDELERRGSRYLFSVNVRPDLYRYIDEATLHRMREAGFIEFLIGSESGSDAILERMRRGHTVAQLVRTLELLKRARIPFVSTYWMVGLPGETLETAAATTSLIKRLMDDDLVFYASAKPFIPLPGTPIFDDPAAWGIRIESHDWSLYERYSVPLPHHHENLTQHEIEAATLLMQSVQAGVFRRRATGDAAEDLGRLQERIAGRYGKAVVL